MDQPFQCSCGHANCKGWIAGAGQMRRAQLEGYWFNPWVQTALNDKWAKEAANGNGATKCCGGCANGKQTSGDVDSPNGKAFATNGERPEKPVGAQNQGASARELAGEMGGDTQ